MIENINSLLEENEIQVRIGTRWFRLEELGPIGIDSFPIFVRDEDGDDYEFDMADIDEFDPDFEMFRNMDSTIVGEA
tara:strand:+ start:530 stop:760 length:231 start_codon:yes stop_codon:yes gene_type:complete